MSARTPAVSIRDVDRGLLTLMLLLLGIGLVMLASASISIAADSTGQPFYYLAQQLVAVAAGFIVALIVISTPTDYWERLGSVMLLAAILLLLLVFVPGLGREVNGATRWISLGGVNLQVSEPARLMVLMYIAGYAVRHKNDLADSFAGMAKPMAIVLFVCGLLIMEPDFGATVVMLAITLGVLFVAGAPLRYFICMVVLVVSALGALAVLEPYRWKRLIGFTDPWSDPYGDSYQLTQSLIAIGSGEWFGAGLGNSVQKLFYLPEAHTDFVFAVIAEEFGVLGTVLLISLFATLVWRAVGIANEAAARERFYQAYLAFGIAIWQGTQVFINIGVNMGVLPTKGLTLPLVSYGRSSLIVTLAALALLLRIDMETRAGASRAKSRGSRANKRRRRK